MIWPNGVLTLCVCESNYTTKWSKFTNCFFPFKSLFPLFQHDYLIFWGGLKLITIQLPPQLWRTRSPCLRNTSLRLSNETSSGSYCGESAIEGTFIFTVLMSSVQHWALLGGKLWPVERFSYFVVLANNHIVGVEEIWDVLLYHIIAWIQRILVKRECQRKQTVRTCHQCNAVGE